jgi:hypothetical protein
MSPLAQKSHLLMMALKVCLTPTQAAKLVAALKPRPA